MIVYLHGFNSSPQSHKAQLMGKYMGERGLADQYACPALPPLAGDAIREIERLGEDRADLQVAVFFIEQLHGRTRGCGADAAESFADCGRRPG